MLSGWWGKLLLILLLGLFGFGAFAAYNGMFLPPLEKAKKHIRQDSKHYTGGRGYRGFFYGGGFSPGK
jgi:hypothetical protein